jgi:hypothetical protein
MPDLQVDAITKLTRKSRSTMPRRKAKNTRKKLEERLEDEIPEDRIPSEYDFTFFTDKTKAKNNYVRVGDTYDLGEEHPRAMHVGLGNKSGSKLIFFNAGTLHPENIIYENKELARLGTMYSSPFDRLAPLRYEYPGSSVAESLRWYTELRALTMFALVWGGYRDEFIDFNKGEGFKVLVEVLKRRPKRTVAAAKKDLSDGAKKIAKTKVPVAFVEGDPVADVVEDVDPNTGMTEIATAAVEGNGLDTTGATSSTSKKRTHEEFEAGQKV